MAAPCEKRIELNTASPGGSLKLFTAGGRAHQKPAYTYHLLHQIGGRYQSAQM
jgi:hypothetical protein